jgi:acyl-CoA thioesterase-1
MTGIGVTLTEDMDEEPAILTVHRSTTVKSPLDSSPARARRDRARRLLLQALGLAALWPTQAFAADRAAQSAASAANSPASSVAERQVLILGDSLSAEYGLGRGEGWVTLLERRTGPKGWAVVNASISGETTAGGLSRLPSLLGKHQPEITVIELGANDALRGLPLAATDANLRKMVRLAKEAGSKPLLVGMMLPPNFGAAYADRFSGMFRRIAESERTALVPFLLEGFADDLSWFQPDRIHPTAKAQPRMLDNVWPVLSKLL